MTDVLLDRSDNANDKLMAKDLADALLSAYPGWLWAVNVDSRAKLIRVQGTSTYPAGTVTLCTCPTSTRPARSRRT